MKRIMIFIISACAAIGLTASCAGTSAAKQEVKPAVKPEVITNSNPDKMKDTSFENVMSVLKSALDAEKANSTSSSKLNTAEAYMLLIKFIRTDRDKVVKSGMTTDDITFLINDARDKAQTRLKDVINEPTSPQSVKDEANSKLKELGMQ